MKKIIDKVMAYFGYYPRVKKPIVRKKPIVSKTTTRKPATKKAVQQK